MDFLFQRLQFSYSTVKKHILCLTLLLIMFVIGIMCGIILKQSKTISSYYASRCDEYAQGVFFGGAGAIILDGVVGFFCVGIAILPLLFHLFFLPIPFLFAFYKGFVCGITAKMLFLFYGLSGGLIFFVVFLPQTVVFSYGFACVSVCSFDSAKYAYRCGVSERMRAFSPHAVSYACYYCLSVALQLLCVLVLFRLLFGVL